MSCKSTECNPRPNLGAWKVARPPRKGRLLSLYIFASRQGGKESSPDGGVVALPLRHHTGIPGRGEQRVESVRGRLRFTLVLPDSG